MIVNRESLLQAMPIVNMLKTKEHTETTSYGLAEAGYDIRLRQTIHFTFNEQGKRIVIIQDPNTGAECVRAGRFTIASAIEEFNLPNNLVGVVHDKSTWARKGLSVFNTVLEPGWKGYLTLELVYHGEDDLLLPAGCGIAQVVFSKTTDLVSYGGKYQNQENKPVAARMDKDHF
jgi:dCTP deaminase